MASFRLPPVLRPLAGGARTVEAGGESLRAALDDLTEQHPALRSRLLGDDGEIATFVNIYVDSEDVRVSGGLDTPLAPSASVIVLPAMAGGSGGRAAVVAPRAVQFCRTVGGTPLVELTRLAPHPEVRLFAKLEWFNPTGSVKDRVACAMLDAAAESGELWPGRRILEPSSGNTGIALAMQGRLRGLDVSIVMPAGSTPEREQLMRLFGADVIYSPAELGSNGAVAMARELSEADPTLYMPFQYGNAANPRAHERGTAEEILAACPEVDVLVAGLGTGGTLMGCARRLRRERPQLQVVAAEPLPGEGIDGLRSLEDGYTPEILDLALLDRKLLVSNEDSVRGLRALAREEGLFAGVSSGGVLHAALRVAGDLDGPANIVMVLADGGWKYLSAGLWDTPETELLERMEQGVWW